MSAPARIAAAFTVLFLVLSASLATASDPKELILLGPDGQPVVDPIEMTGIVVVRADGSIEITTDQPPACNEGGGCEGVQVGTPSFSVNKATAEVGESLAFNWNSRGAWECRGGGTLTGWNTRTGLPPNSANATPAQRTVSTGSLEPGSYTATLLCVNGPAESDGGDPRSLALSLTDPPPPDPGLPEFCSNADRRAPDTWARLDTAGRSCHWSGNSWLSGSDCRTWEGVWGVPFNPNGTGTTNYLGTRPSLAQGYIAMRFNSGSFASSDTGTFVVSPAPNIEGPRKIVSISQCPGDFNEAAINDRAAGGTGCIIESAEDDLRWGGSSTSRACKLQPNTTYFLNIVFTLAPLADLTWSDMTVHPFCVANNCGNLFRNR